MLDMRCIVGEAGMSVMLLVRGIYFLSMPTACLALSRTESSLWESFSREALSCMDWPVDFWLSGMTSLDRRISLMCFEDGEIR